MRAGATCGHFVHALERWLIATLARFGVAAHTDSSRVGIWTHDAAGREAKIGAIGVRVRRWVTLHGFALNVAPDLAHFSGIVPCGLPDFQVTSLAALGSVATLKQFDAALVDGLRIFCRICRPPGNRLRLLVHNANVQAECDTRSENRGPFRC